MPLFHLAPICRLGFRIHQIRLHTKLNIHGYFKNLYLKFPTKDSWLNTYNDVLYLTVITNLLGKGLKSLSHNDKLNHRWTISTKQSAAKFLEIKIKRISFKYLQRRRKKIFNWAHLTCTAENKIMGIVNH